MSLTEAERVQVYRTRMSAEKQKCLFKIVKCKEIKAQFSIYRHFSFIKALNTRYVYYYR